MIKRLFLQLVSDERRDPVARALQSFLWILSGLYRILLMFRDGLLRVTGSRREGVGCPVVSVGNLTWGGTGKTPLVQYLVSRLVELGFRPGVISRAGEDEVTLLREKLKGVPVVLSQDRLRAARFVRKHFGADCLVLDDGLQERRLKKNLEIIILNSRSPFGNGHLIPRGILREPPSRLRDGHWVLLNKANSLTPGRKKELLSRVRSLNSEAPIAESVYRVTGIFPLAGGGDVGVDQVKGKPVAIVAAIADPQSFRETVRDLGGRIVRETFLPDHHPFSRRELEWFLELASGAGVEQVLVTEKDAVKIRPLVKGEDLSGPPIFSVGIRLEMTQGKEELGGLLRALRRS